MTLKTWHAVILGFVLIATAVNVIAVVAQHKELGSAHTRSGDIYAPYYVEHNRRLHTFVNRRAAEREILILGFAFIAWFSGWFSATQKAKKAV